MINEADEYYTASDIVAIFRGYFLYSLRKWYWLLAACFLGGLLGAGAYSLQKPKYEADCTFILEEKQGGLGGLGGIASQFGIDIGGLGGTSMFAGDNILDILKSSAIVQRVLLTKVDSAKAAGGPTLADAYLAFSGLHETKGLQSVSYAGAAAGSHTLLQDSVLQEIQEALVKKAIVVDRISRKGTIISVTVTSPDPVFSKLMAERIVGEARNMYIAVKAGTAQANVHRLEMKADSILRQLNAKTYLAAQQMQVDANPALRILNVPTEISSRDKSVLGAVYLEVVKNLEVSKTLLNQQTPIIQVLDAPVLPLKNKKKGLVLLMIVFAMLGAGLFAVRAWFGFRAQHKPAPTAQT